MVADGDTMLNDHENKNEMPLDVLLLLESHLIHQQICRFYQLMEKLILLSE